MFAFKDEFDSYNTKPKHADTHMFGEMRTCAI